MLAKMDKIVLYLAVIKCQTIIHYLLYNLLATTLLATLKYEIKRSFHVYFEWWVKDSIVFNEIIQ